MWILLEQIDYEGSSFIGAYTTKEGAMAAAGESEDSFESTPLADCWRRPTGAVARWHARKKGHDVTWIIWEVRV